MIPLLKETFYRGITVSIEKVDKIIQKIFKQGISVGQGRWMLTVPDLRGVDLLKLIQDPKLNTSITRKKSINTFAATGDYNSALFYACKHNRTEENTEGVIIEFNVSLNRVFIDGRDFLYSVFQWYNRQNKGEMNKKHIKQILIKIYGSGIIPYVNQVFKTPYENQNRRIALVNVAVNDKKCVISHKKNKIWINGRYGTWFRSSFLIEGKIPPDDIVNVEHVKCDKIVFDRKVPPYVTPDFYISLRDLI